MDVVLLHDVLQMITDTDSLLWELHRVLKSGGVLYATSEHLEIDEFMDIMMKRGLFTRAWEREGLFEFWRA